LLIKSYNYMIIIWLRSQFGIQQAKKNTDLSQMHITKTQLVL